GAAYELASFIRPRMYGSTDMTRLRTSTSPSRGSRTSVSVSRKSSGTGQPRGRRTSCHSRETVIPSPPFSQRWISGLEAFAQLAPQHLARRRHRDLVDDMDRAELLVRRHALVHPRHDGVGV